MRRHSLASIPITIAACLTLFLAVPAAHASSALPSNARPLGHSSQDWLARVGQYYLGDATNPLIASLSGDCGELRHGVFWMAAPIDLHLQFECSVPTGTWIVVSPAAWFSTEGFDGTTDAELEAAAIKGFTTSINWCTLDGRDVPLVTLDTGPYEVQSEPGSFYDSILGVGTGPIRTVLRGNVVVIHPLRPGDHTLRSAVSFVGDGAYSATYSIHVS
jgi:hypothetical protein